MKEPEYLLSEHKRIKGLDGSAKMGKSLGNAIYLADDEDTIREKVRGAITDTSKIRKDDPANPDVCMVGYYHKLFSKNNLDTICAECRAGARGCVACKKELADNIIEHLRPIKERRKYYEERPELVKEILRTGTEKARKITKEIMEKVRYSMRTDYFNN